MLPYQAFRGMRHYLLQTMSYADALMADMKPYAFSRSYNMNNRLPLCNVNFIELIVIIIMPV